MFSNTEYEARKKHFNDIVRDSQHHQLVQTIEATQPRSHSNLIMFLVRLGQRRPRFNTPPRLRDREFLHSRARKRVA